MFSNEKHLFLRRLCRKAIFDTCAKNIFFLDSQKIHTFWKRFFSACVEITIRNSSDHKATRLLTINISQEPASQYNLLDPHLLLFYVVILLVFILHYGYTIRSCFRRSGGACIVKVGTTKIAWGLALCLPPLARLYLSLYC